MEGIDRRRWWADGWIPVAGAAAVAVALTLRATARYGPGAEPDTVTYLAAARHLRTGHGFADIDGSPLTLFPPGFPVAVAVLEYCGLAPLPAARFLNAALFGLLVVLGAVWTRRISGSPTLGAVVAVVVAVATPMVAMASNALSEPMGVVAVVACLLLLTEVLRTGAMRYAAGAGLAAAVAGLTRYASVVLFPVGAVVVLAWPAGWRVRIRLGAAFLAVGVLPFGAWLARNVAAGGNATGDGRGTSALTLVTSLKLTFAAVGAWFVPDSGPVVPRAVAGALVCLGVAGLLLWGTRRRGALETARLALPAALFVIAGVGSVAWFEATMGIDPPPRFLLPVFVPLVVGTAAIVADRAHRSSWRPPVTVVVGVVVAVVGVSLPRLDAFVRTADRAGLLDYSTPAWASSPLLAYVQDHPVRGMVASDDPYILDLRLGLAAELTPARTYYASDEPADELPAFVARAALAAAAGGLWVAWFPRSYHPYLYSLSDLQRAVCLTVERQFSDGELLHSCPARI